MKQCKLQKGNIKTTSWLPEKFAVEGKCLRLKENNKWSDGWLVISTSDFSLPADYVIDRSQDYKRTRKASDI